MLTFELVGNLLRWSILPLLAGCLDPVGFQGGRDAAADAVIDAGTDAVDGGFDAEPPVCEPTRWPDTPSGPGGLERMERYFALRDVVLDQGAALARIGWDLDGLCTADAASRGCRGDAIDSFAPDGRAGLDNAFGTMVLPAITAVRSDLERTVRDRMENGETLILGIRDWNGTDTDSEVTFSMVRTAGLADGREEPRWDGTDRYLQDEDGFIDIGPLTDNKIIDKGAYLIDGVLVGRIPERQPVVFPWLDGSTIGLTLLDGQVTARLGPDLQTLSEVWITGRMSVFDVRRMWDEAGFCEGDDIRRIVDASVNEALDMLINDGISGADIFCDAISIGIEFRARQVELGDRGPVERPNQCDDNET
ncbi:MAG: hypothetical protein AAGE52_29615 [Myxococcota bacterium]